MGLSAVPPYADSDYARLRRELAIARPGAVERRDQSSTACSGFIPICASSESRTRRASWLSSMRWRALTGRGLTSTGRMCWRTGTHEPNASQSGWLNRALASVPADRSSTRKELGVALGQNVPLVMRARPPWRRGHRPDLRRSTKTRLSASRISTRGIRCSRSDSPMRWQRNAIATAAQKDDAESEPMMPARCATTLPAQGVRTAGETRTGRRARGRPLRRSNSRGCRLSATTRMAPASRCSTRRAGTRTRMKAPRQGQLALRLGALDAGPPNAEGAAWPDLARHTQC